MSPEWQASIEATLCDFFKGISDRQWRKEKPEDLWKEFLSKYHVEQWDIKANFFAFFDDVFKNKRCGTCGSKEFPYFIAGDKECIRCLT